MTYYLTQRKNMYHYRRRVPTLLIDYFESPIYYKSLSSDFDVAKVLSVELTQTFNKAVTMVKLGLEPDLSTVTEMVGDVDVGFGAIAKAYLKTLSITSGKLTQYEGVVKTVVYIIKDTVTHQSLDKLRTSLQKLPKRNIHKYRVMPMEKIVKVRAPTEERLTAKSVNEYIKVVNAVLSYGYDRTLIDRQYRIKLFPIMHQARTEREALSITEIRALIESATPAYALSYQLLYLSGMRLSEAYKCTLTVVDGIECFDLRHSGKDLKNNNSYRLIPVHTDIIYAEDSLATIRSIHPSYLSRKASKALQGKKKTLYSLRHSFATHLSATGIQVAIISELMGHAHSSMTMSRYSKGYPVKVLKDAIDGLAIDQCQRKS